MNRISINTFIMSSGERYCLVIDKRNGMPLYYPNLYITTQIRNGGSSISTVELVAGSISLLCNFFHERGIDIEERIRLGTNLSINELDSLRDYTEKKVRLKRVIPYNVKKSSVVTTATKHFRLTNIANYLNWLIQILIPMSNNTAKQNQDFINKIKARRPKIKNQSVLSREDRSLNEKQMKILLEIIQVGSDKNPFDEDVQVRNRLIILVLYSLGIRSGELLNIRISDINFTDSSLAIRRRADDKADPRVKQPLVKTMERKLPLSKQLVKELHNFITKTRKDFKNAKKHEYLFLTHKSGPTQGKPLSAMAYHKIIDAIRNVDPELYKLTGHKLRHTWNYEFSKMLDRMTTPLNETEQADMRSALMGWVQGSDTAKIYNKRYIQDKANDVAIALQEDINKKDKK
ncbi:MAG: site-specific integrase [Pantoea sp.]|uniref:tyrosine-type recombinase/integrase n=1 Tax=Pantoea sp. TaxID=69393 RepID=UPI0039E5FA30